MSSCGARMAPQNQRTVMTPEYPVIFTVQDAISGNGFLSSVKMCGRALVYRDVEGTWWITGVHPGGMAHRGESMMEAYSNFRNSYRTVLFDIAEEASNFDAFKSEVERFYRECGPEEDERWNTALQALRSGDLVPEQPVAALPRHTPETRPCAVEIVRLDQIASNRFSAKNNIPDTLELPIAA